ncbi:hypothetical protein ACJJTC_000702 [Scirpophaga incertulas]
MTIKSVNANISELLYVPEKTIYEALTWSAVGHQRRPNILCSVSSEICAAESKQFEGGAILKVRAKRCSTMLRYELRCYEVRDKRNDRQPGASPGTLSIYHTGLSGANPVQLPSLQCKVHCCDDRRAVSRCGKRPHTWRGGVQGPVARRGLSRAREKRPRMGERAQASAAVRVGRCGGPADSRTTSGRHGGGRPPRARSIPPALRAYSAPPHCTPPRPASGTRYTRLSAQWHAVRTIRYPLFIPEASNLNLMNPNS